MRSEICTYVNVKRRTPIVLHHKEVKIECLLLLLSIFKSTEISLCVCLSVQFFNPLPVVEFQIQAQFWNTCATAVKMKLFAVPLKQKQKKIALKFFTEVIFFALYKLI